MKHYTYKIEPDCPLNELILTKNIRNVCRDLIHEQNQLTTLRNWNLEPRHKILIRGPSGTGKSLLANCLAYELATSLFITDYGYYAKKVIGNPQAYAEYFEGVFDQKQRHMLLLDNLDNFLGEPEKKAHIESLLIHHIRSTPSHVILIATSNQSHSIHHNVLQNFELDIVLTNPSADQIYTYLERIKESLREDYPSLKANYNSRVLAEKFERMQISFEELTQFRINYLRQCRLNSLLAISNKIDPQRLLKTQFSNWNYENTED